jgi:hypothetical protein
LIVHRLSSLEPTKGRKQIVFDRLRENSHVVMIDLPKEQRSSIKHPSDGQLFPNPVKEGLPTILELGDFGPHFSYPRSLQQQATFVALDIANLPGHPVVSN